MFDRQAAVPARKGNIVEKERNKNQKEKGNIKFEKGS